MNRGIFAVVLCFVLIPTAAHSERIENGVWEIELSGSAGKESYEVSDFDLGSLSWARIQPEIGYYFANVLQARLVAGIDRQSLDPSNPLLETQRSLDFLIFGEILITAPNDTGALPYVALGAGTVLRKDFSNMPNTETTKLVPSIEIGIKMFPVRSASINLGLGWATIENPSGIDEWNANHLSTHLGLSIYLGRSE